MNGRRRAAITGGRIALTIAIDRGDQERRAGRVERDPGNRAAATYSDAAAMIQATNKPQRPQPRPRRLPVHVRPV